MTLCNTVCYGTAILTYSITDTDNCTPAMQPPPPPMEHSGEPLVNCYCSSALSKQQHTKLLLLLAASQAAGTEKLLESGARIAPTGPVRVLQGSHAHGCPSNTNQQCCKDIAVEGQLSLPKGTDVHNKTCTERSCLLQWAALGAHHTHVAQVKLASRRAKNKASHTSQPDQSQRAVFTPAATPKFGTRLCRYDATGSCETYIAAE